MDKNGVKDLIDDIEKYVSILCEKVLVYVKEIQLGHDEYEKSKSLQEETSENYQKIKQQLSDIHNEHEELQIKFTNLQQHLEKLICEKETILEECSEFIVEKKLSKEKIREISTIIEIYHKEIKSQVDRDEENANLKTKLDTLSDKYFNLGKKYNESKNHIATMIGKEPTKDENQECLSCIKLKEVLEGEKEMQKSMEMQMERFKSKFEEEQEKAEKLRGEFEELENNGIIVKEEMIKNREENETLEKQLQNICSENKKNMEKLTNKMEGLNCSLREKLEEISNFEEKVKNYEKEIEVLSNIALDTKEKEKIILVLREEIEKYIKENNSLEQSYKHMEQEHAAKIKTLEWNCQQEKMKYDNIKLNLNSYENKQNENMKTIDKIYEENMNKNGKIGQMEIKLKEYKHMIHYLKKEKSDIEKSYEKKLKSMEGTRDEEDSETSSNLDNSPNIIDQSPRDVYDQNYEQLKISFEDKVFNLEKVIDVLKEEISKLKAEKDKLIENNLELENRIKYESHKREEVAKEIKRITSAKTFQNLPIKQKKNSNEFSAKDGKIAEKAYKGLDILAKSLTKLYKEFISVYVGDLEKKETKEIEGTINSILRNTLDMKDIFQDYF